MKSRKFADIKEEPLNEAGGVTSPPATNKPKAPGINTESNMRRDSSIVRKKTSLGVN